MTLPLIALLALRASLSFMNCGSLHIDYSYKTLLSLIRVTFESCTGPEEDFLFFFLSLPFFCRLSFFCTQLPQIAGAAREGVEVGVVRGVWPECGTPSQSQGRINTENGETSVFGSIILRYKKVFLFSVLHTNRQGELKIQEIILLQRLYVLDHYKEFPCKRVSLPN